MKLVNVIKFYTKPQIIIEWQCEMKNVGLASGKIVDLPLEARKMGNYLGNLVRIVGSAFLSREFTSQGRLHPERVQWNGSLVI